MKNFLLIVLVAMLSGSAFAEIQLGSTCPGGGQLSQTENAVMSCRDGKLTKFSMVGTASVSIKVVVTDGEKILLSSQINTLDGQPTPISIGQEKSYIAEARRDGNGEIVLTPGKVKTGIFLTLTPVLAKNGAIDVDFTILKSDLDSMQKYKQGGLEVELPQITSAGLTQKVAMESGKETVIPFGPLVASKDSSPAHTKYKLKMIATKGPPAPG